MAVLRDCRLQVRDSPLYYIIQAKIQQAKGSNEEAVNTLTTAMKLPGVKQAGSHRHRPDSTVSHALQSRLPLPPRRRARSRSRWLSACPCILIWLRRTGSSVARHAPLYHCIPRMTRDRARPTRSSKTR